MDISGLPLHLALLVEQFGTVGIPRGSDATPDTVTALHKDVLGLEHAPLPLLPGPHCGFLGPSLAQLCVGLHLCCE